MNRNVSSVALLLTLGVSDNTRSLPDVELMRTLTGDTVTVPTMNMLQSMIKTTLGDDVFNEDEVTSAFEAHVAKLLGHEMGLFVASGTAGNQIALRCHLTQPPHSVLCHHRSHIVTAEAGGTASLSQAMVQAIVPAKTVNLTLEDGSSETTSELSMT